MAKPHYVGETITFSCRFRDRRTGSAIDPATVTLRLEAPNGAVADYSYGGAEVVKQATGAYLADVELLSAGTWFWRWLCDNPAVGIAEGALKVIDGQIPDV